MNWAPTLARRGLYWLGFTYISLSFLYDRFYGVFGVSSSDVGFGPAQGTGDVVIGVLRVGAWLTIMLLTVTLIAFGCGVVLAFVAERCSTTRRGDGKSTAWLGRRLARWIGVTPKDILPVVLAAGGLWFVAYAVLGTISVALQWFDFISIAVVPVGWWIYTRWRKDRRASSPNFEAREPDAKVEFWHWKKARRRELAGLLTIYAFASSAFVFTDLWGDVADAAREAQGARPQCTVPDIGAPLPLRVHVTLLDARAEPATISWIGGDEPPGVLPDNPKEKPIFLGGASGATFVAVKNGGSVYHAVRVPDAKVVIDIDKSSPLCPSVH